MQGIFGKKERGERSEQVRHLMSTHPAFSFFKSSILAPSSSREGLSQVKSNLPCASCFERALAKVMDGIEKDQLLFPGCFTYCLRELEIAFEHLIVRAAALQNEKGAQTGLHLHPELPLVFEVVLGVEGELQLLLLGLPDATSFDHTRSRGNREEKGLLLSVFFFSSDVDSAMDQVASHMVGLIRVSSMTFGAFG